MLKALNKNDFDSKAVTQAEELYSKAQLSPTQRQMMEPLAKEVAKYVPISELALRGFFMMSVPEWQQKHNMLLSDADKQDLQGRLKVLDELCDFLGNRLKTVLKFKGKEKELAVDEGIKNLKRVYLKEYKPKN